MHFQPENFTGWGSEGVKLSHMRIRVLIEISQNNKEYPMSCACRYDEEMTKQIFLEKIYDKTAAATQQDLEHTPLQ